MTAVPGAPSAVEPTPTLGPEVRRDAGPAGTAGGERSGPAPRRWWRRKRSPNPWRTEILSRLEKPGCLICREAVANLARYYFWFIVEQYANVPTMEGLQRAHGFCLRHTRHLLERRVPDRTSVVGRYVLQSCGDWLRTVQAAQAPERRGSRKSGRLLSGRLRPLAGCPACVQERQNFDLQSQIIVGCLEEADIARAFCASHGLCLPHFLVAGRRPREAPAARAADQGTGDSAVSASWSPAFEETRRLLSQPGCGICRVAARGREEYLAWLEKEIRDCTAIHYRWSQTLYLCSEHAWLFADRCAPEVLATACGHLLERIVGALRQLLWDIREPIPRSLAGRVRALPTRWRENSRPESPNHSRPSLSQRIRGALGTLWQTPQDFLDRARARALYWSTCPVCFHLETMDSEFKPVLLNPSQLRAVGATLRLVEQAVDDIERLLAAPAAGITYRLAEDLDAEDRQTIQMACGRVRTMLAEACWRLGVEVVERSRRREIRGEVATLWALLEDTKSAALRGYGPLSPDAGSAVDERLDEISQAVIGIFRLVEGPRPGVVVRGSPMNQ